MKITKEFLESLTAMAQTSPHLKEGKEISGSAKIRIVALEPGAIQPVSSEGTSSLIYCLKGNLRVVYYDGLGRIVENIDLSQDGACNGIVIPSRQWYTYEVISPGTVILQCGACKVEDIQSEDLMY